MDALQITAAILLTGGLLVSAAPLPEVFAPSEEPVAVIETVEVVDNEPEAPKKVDDPNNCEPEQLWAKESPYQCIDKPTPTKSVSHVAILPPTAFVPSGNKQSWLVASGIPQGQWGSVDYLVSRESGWNPNAVNASSGACGLGQQLPCGKWVGAWNDPVAALIAMNGYVNARYGGWVGAVGFWQVNNWY